ncbi:MAG TPA: hypothetical protein VGF75_00225 [Candidatus Saccharimonadales bacterium]
MATIVKEDHYSKQIQHRLKPEEIDQLVNAYKAGELVKDLADRFLIHRTTVIEHVKRSGVKLRNRPY